MTTETYTLFFASLSLLLLFFMFTWIVSLLADRNNRVGFRSMFNPLALELAAGVAITCMAGSLVLSEALNFLPCKLCWVQRAFMYPAAILLSVELVKRHFKPTGKPFLAYAAAGFAIGGIPVSIFHRIEQQKGAEIGGFCDPTNPCSSKLVEHFGFVTIPTMAGIGFTGIIFFVAMHFFANRPTS